MDRRKLFVTVATVSLFAGLLTGAFLMGSSSVPTASAGILARDLGNAHRGGVPATERISLSTGKGAQVAGNVVTWYTAAGQQETTDMGSSATALALFSKYGYYDFSINSDGSTAALLVQLAIPLIFLLVFVYIFVSVRKGGIPGMQIGKSRARLLDTPPAVSFADVAGADEAVAELAEVVAVLRDPGRFLAMGARVPRGVLLAGPPGTGKTLLARAVAGEAGVPFFSLSASEFVEMFVGVGAARVRDLFSEARKRSPAILFIDEIDAVGRHRGASPNQSNDEREQTLNQLLVEMDGFETGSPVIVIAATNRPDVLDPALLRPGRFDRRVVVDSPDVVGRQKILDLHARGKPLAQEVDLAAVARQTTGATGADLANVVNEAALLAARHERSEITTGDLEEAVIRIQAGPERSSRLMSEQERITVAYHEMGHALVAYTLPHADPVHRISIVARGQALGWTMILPERDRALTSRAQLADQLAGMMGGRCAEELTFGEDVVTTGAADDIERATALAARMVRNLGMGSLGLRTFPEGEIGFPRGYSEKLAERIDAEVDSLLEEAAQRARDVLADRMDILQELARHLLRVETMEADEFARIVNSYSHRPLPASSVVPLHGHSALMPLPIAAGGEDLGHGSGTSPVLHVAFQGQRADTAQAPPRRSVRSLLRFSAWMHRPSAV